MRSFRGQLFVLALKLKLCLPGRDESRPVTSALADVRDVLGRKSRQEIDDSFARLVEILRADWGTGINRQQDVQEAFTSTVDRVCDELSPTPKHLAQDAKTGSGKQTFMERFVRLDREENPSDLASKLRTCASREIECPAYLSVRAHSEN